MEPLPLIWQTIQQVWTVWQQGIGGTLASHEV
jgi:hypothetical protein